MIAVILYESLYLKGKSPLTAHNMEESDPRLSYLYSGVFRDERVLQLLHVLTNLADSAFAKLREIASEGVTDSRERATRFCKGLDALVNWKTPVRVSIAQSAIDEYPDLPILYKYAIIRYIKEIFKHEKSKQIPLTIPPFHDFLHSYYSALASNPCSKNLSYFTLYGVERTHLHTEALRQALIQSTRSLNYEMLENIHTNQSTQPAPPMPDFATPSRERFSATRQQPSPHSQRISESPRRQQGYQQEYQQGYQQEYQQHRPSQSITSPSPRPSPRPSPPRPPRTEHLKTPHPGKSTVAIDDDVVVTPNGAIHLDYDNEPNDLDRLDSIHEEYTSGEDNKSEKNEKDDHDRLKVEKEEERIPQLPPPKQSPPRTNPHSQQRSQRSPHFF